MRNILRAIAFPFILGISIIQALVSKPFKLSLSKDGGLEMGIFPFLLANFLIILITQLIKQLL